MKKLLLAAALIASLPVQADGLLLGGWSHHLDDGDYNETNNLIAVEYNNVVAGTFENSFDNRTYFLGYDFVADYQYFSVGVIAAMSKGYKKENFKESIHWAIIGDDLMPAAIPYIKINTPYVSPVIGVLGTALFATFKIDF